MAQEINSLRTFGTRIGYLLDFSLIEPGGHFFYVDMQLYRDDYVLTLITVGRVSLKKHRCWIKISGLELAAIAKTPQNRAEVYRENIVKLADMANAFWLDAWETTQAYLGKVI